MTFKDVGVQVRGAPAADGLHEVAEVVIAAFELADNLAVGPHGNPGRVAGADQEALGRVEDVADEVVAGLAFHGYWLWKRFVRRLPAHLEYQLAIGVL